MHECSRGCAIYADRPNACRQFECLWLTGVLPRELKPNRTGVVVWATVMIGTKGEQLGVVQANVRRNRRISSTMMYWIKLLSHKAPLSVVRGQRNTLYQDGRVNLRWHQDDFFTCNIRQGRLVDLVVRPRAEVLATDAAEEQWERTMRDAMIVREDATVDQDREND